MTSTIILFSCHKKDPFTTLRFILITLGNARRKHEMLVVLIWLPEIDLLREIIESVCDCVIWTYHKKDLNEVLCINSLENAMLIHNLDSVTKQMSCFVFYKTKEENLPSTGSQKSRWLPSFNHQNKSIIHFRKLFQYLTEKESDKMYAYVTKIGFTLQFCVRLWHLQVQKRIRELYLWFQGGGDLVVTGWEVTDLDFSLHFALDFFFFFI